MIDSGMQRRSEKPKGKTIEELKRMDKKRKLTQNKKKLVVLKIEGE